MSDELYMRRCFELALHGAGAVSPNPMVGAVLVCDDQIIGEGWHKAYGQAHAEVNCFESVADHKRHLIPQSTLYCSLEPCVHYGKTPPCVNLILRHHVPRVVVANTDPNPLVAGAGLAKLRQAGVIVLDGVLATEGAWLNRIFFTWITQKRPFVVLKWAHTADGFLGSKGERTAVSGPLTQRLVHRWRAALDAILVGAGTAIVDNPKLDVRHYFGKSPMRVLLDGNGTVPIERHLLQDANPTIIFGPFRPGLPQQKKFITVEGAIPVVDILKALQKENLTSLLVEGGAQVLQQFLDQQCWDELRIIENPATIGAGIEAPPLPAGAVLREKFRVGADTVSIYAAPKPTRIQPIV